MYKVFTDDDVDVILDWLDSLRSETIACIEPLSNQPVPSDSGKAVAELITRVARRAKRAHDMLTLPDADGKPIPLSGMFDDPIGLMKGLIRGGWVIPAAPDRSIFITRLFENGGPMAGELPPKDVELLKKWIADGAPIPSDTEEATKEEVAVEALVISGEAPDAEMTLLEMRPFIGQGTVH